MASTLTLEILRRDYRDRILALAAAHDLRDVRVFGSVARGKAREDSDIDLLVARIPGGDAWGIGGFYADMQDLMGRKVDVAMEGGLSPYIRDAVMREAVPL